MKYTFTRKQIVNAFNNKILDDDNFLTYLLSTTSKDRPINQKSLDKKKVKDVSKCCNCNVNVSNGKEGTNYYIYDKCKQPCDVIGKTKELDWEKEFDNDCWDTKDGVMTVTYLMKGGNKVGRLTERVTKEMIKSYVKIRLTQQRTELLEQILNLECLKEESGEFDQFWLANQLRKEIKEEITKDLFKDFKQVSNPLDVCENCKSDTPVMTTNSDCPYCGNKI